MTMTDDELVERLRSTLQDWADEAPVSPSRGVDGGWAVPYEGDVASAGRPSCATVAAAVVAVTIAGVIVWVRHDTAERAASRSGRNRRR